MNELKVYLGDKSYPIYIGDGLLLDAGLFKRHICSKQVMLVTNNTVASLYLDQVRQRLDEFQPVTCVLPDGEQYKTLEMMNEIITRLLQARFSRTCCLLALGGGVIGDITGFAAACYQRGVGYVQLPTTLLAQVDSAVGGKTAVNHPLGKNMIGAFHQPLAVISDISVLDTLNDRELHAGLAEVIKYGLIRDCEFFHWLDNNITHLLGRKRDVLIHAVERSCRNKAEVVASDEKESGFRALLNLGHTFGHAIETGLGYKEWLHGEAVATGMLMAADLSGRHGWLPDADVDRIRKILVAAQLPVRLPPSLNSKRMLDLMSVDKKARDGILRLVLLKGIGNALVTDEFDPGKLLQTLDSFQ
ncbi:MAG: 3-dehydroquinate synthase [Gammaproteobacteria bacterium]